MNNYDIYKHTYLYDNNCYIIHAVTYTDSWHIMSVERGMVVRANSNKEFAGIVRYLLKLKERGELDQGGANV